VKLLSDHNLMLAVRQGNLDSMSNLFEKFHRPLYNYFLHNTGKREASEDLVQEVFYKMIKYRHTYKDTGNFKSWMYTIARNSQIDYFRNLPKAMELDIKNTDLQLENSNPDTHFENTTNLNFLRKALFMLPDEKREVLLLSRFLDLKYQDIGEVLGCTVSNVKVKVHRALKELSQLFLKLTSEAKNEL
jgi:RNA polymerase sigma factor (sigma-70 family)